MSSFRTVVADDEPPARRRISELLERSPQHEIVAQCASGPETVTAVQREQPDLLFLDVQMPGLSGMQVLHALSEQERPVVIFTTAYDEYTLQAFDEHAVDYLLKPFTDARFFEALGRAERRLKGEEALEWRARFRAFLGSWEDNAPLRAAPALDRFAVKGADAITIVPASAVDWIEAARDYVKLHAGREVFLVRTTIAALSERLDSHDFMRVHRSTIVRVDRIRELQPYFRGDYVLILRDGTRLRLSRSYRKALQRRVGLNGDETR